MRRRRNPEVIAGRVNADGSIAAGDGFTVTPAGGNYTVTLLPGFRLIAASANPAAGGGAFTTTLAAFTERSFLVTMVTAGAAATQPFSFIAVGVQT